MAIDGPSGAGKSTSGRELARRLGYVYVDTGAMYRAVGLAAIRAGASPDDAAAVTALARASRIDLLDGGRRVALDGRDVTAEVRTRDVSAAASRVSVHPAVRREMVARQREMGKDGGVVLDGRDIGTAVFPDAEVKFYLDADASRRAVRRHRELAENGVAGELESIEREIRDRDHLDSSRPDSPLTRAPDAVYLDTTELGPEEVVARMLAEVEARRQRAG